MPNDKKENRLLGGLRHSSRLDNKPAVAKPDKKSTKINQSKSSLSKLLVNKKSTRKSFSFEEDDGFVFKRATNKASDNNGKENPVPSAKISKKKPTTKEPANKEQIVREPLRRTRNSLLAQIETPSEDEDNAQHEPAPVLVTETTAPKKRGRKPKQSFAFDTDESKPTTKRKKPTKKQQKIQPPVSPPISSPAKPPQHNNNNNNDIDYEEHETSIQMTLPLTDSPAQKRNKNLRDSSKRRSSLGNRGKRVSSIGNGFVAVPHSDVPAEDFYKHLDENLPEPHKMRRLLIWCSKRLLEAENSKLKLKQKRNQTSSDELTAFNIAKVIKEEIIRDLVDGRLNASWYSRVDDDEINDDEEKPVRLLPNTQNLTNLANITLFEKRLKDLREEKAKWIAAQKSAIAAIDAPTDIKIEEIPLANEIAQLDSSFANFNDKVIKSGLLERQVDNLDKLVNNLKTNEQVLSLMQEKIKGRLNSVINDYTVISSGNPEDTEQLLKGISRIDGEEEETQLK